MKLITKEQEEEIIELSKTLKQIELKNIFNIPLERIRKILKKNNVSTNRNRLNLGRLKFNINYFDEIDEPKKAYWLGYLAADGSLKNKKVKLVSKDLDVIEKFKRDLESEHAITVVNSYDKRTNKTYTSYHIQITSYLFTEKVSKYIPIDKSVNFKIPNISKEFYPEFLAGMVDGDGSFLLRNGTTKTLVVNLISTKECLLEIQNYLYSVLNINKTKLQVVTINQPNVWMLFIYSGAKDFLNLIYRNDDKNIYLKRKQDKLNEIIKYKENNPNIVGSQKRRPINVYDENNKLIYEFNSTKECVEVLKMSTQTLFNRLKNDELYKGMRFKGLDLKKTKYDK